MAGWPGTAQHRPALPGAAHTHRAGIILKYTASRINTGSLALPPELADTLTELLNSSKAANTFRAEASVKRQIENISAQWGIDLSFPWEQGKALAFIAALAQRGLKGATIKVQIMWLGGFLGS